MFKYKSNKNWNFRSVLPQNKSVNYTNTNGNNTNGNNKKFTSRSNQLEKPKSNQLEKPKSNQLEKPKSNQLEKITSNQLKELTFNKLQNIDIQEIYKNNREIGLYASLWVIKYSTINNQFSDLEKLIYNCKNNKYFKIVDLLEINNIENNKINIAFRCDIDCDIHTAKKMSDLFKNNKIISTFFVLHTSNYYRQNDNYPIERCDDLKENILDIFNDYCSIGLHLDPLHVYINLNNDGSQEVLNEINWLRTFTKIKSICAHNSYYVNGAENFEIFKEISYSNRDFFNYKNKKIPLSTLSLQELELTEINYPIIKKNANIELSDNTWHRFKLFHKAVYDNEIFTHNYDINIWCVGKDEWLISNIKEKYFSIENLNFVLNYLDTLNYETISNIVFNLHPIYFSR